MPLHFNPWHFNNAHFEAEVAVPQSQMGKIIARSGETFELLTRSQGSADEYGNPVVGYVTGAFGYAVISVAKGDERFLIPGTTERADAIGFFESSLAIEAGSRINAEKSGTWQVLFVKKVVKQRKVSHLEAYLRKVETE